MKKNNGLKINFGNRGKKLEDWVNQVNEVYKLKGIALITKIPTEFKFIDNRFFPAKKSIVDFLGVYASKAIAFDTKSTKNKTSFSLSLIHDHQEEYLNNFMQIGGIAFYLIYFEEHDQLFILMQKDLFLFKQFNTRKSIPFHWFLNHAIEVDLTQNKFDYLGAIANGS